jgi:hypothetical protein
MPELNSARAVTLTVTSVMLGSGLAAGDAAAAEAGADADVDTEAEADAGADELAAALEAGAGALAENAGALEAGAELAGALAEAGAEDGLVDAGREDALAEAVAGGLASPQPARMRPAAAAQPVALSLKKRRLDIEPGVIIEPSRTSSEPRNFGQCTAEPTLPSNTRPATRLPLIRQLRSRTMQ